MNRRKLMRGMLLGGGAIAAACGVYGWSRGIRFPVLQVEPDARAMRMNLLDPPIDLDMAHLYLRHAERRDDTLALDLRAFAPQCQLSISAARRVPLDITLRNLSPRARVECDTGRAMDETRLKAVNRRIRLEVPPGRHRLTIRVPFTEQFRFALIGDTGGGSEFAWCLRRAADLGADFLLHAGDFYYSPADHRSLPDTLDAAPLPVYASIGNHDFHGEGDFVHRHFTRDVGPRNTFFSLGRTLIVNFDTAASTWPVDGGDRAAMFDHLAARRDAFDHCVLLTHRPLHDPRVAAGTGESHALAGREVAWVSRQLKALVSKPVLLAGHIHVSAEHREDDIHTYVSGDGLGNRNLVSGREIARILVGEKRPAQDVTYQWQPLNMPKTAHCHDKGRETLNMSGKPFPEASFGPDCPV